MFTYLMTYLQVLPSFLEYVFPFGRQHYVTDFHFSGFRNTSRLRADEAGPEIPQLSVSGRYIELCYSLKSVEPYDDEERPWSIRQCSVYHAFDLETNKTTWITVKGNDFMKDLITSHVNSKRRQRASNTTSTVEPFRDTLATHLLLCHWASQNWHWYVNFLESSLQNTTRRTLSVSVDPPKTKPRLDLNSDQLIPQRRIVRKPSSGFVQIAVGVMQHLHKLRGQKLSSTVEETELPCTMTSDVEQCPVAEEATFSFSDLQHVQFVEEKAAEVLLVLKANTNNLTQLRDSYLSMTDSEELGVPQQGQYRAESRKFAANTSGVIADLAMQVSRVESLIRLVGERKSLVR